MLKLSVPQLLKLAFYQRDNRHLELADQTFREILTQDPINYEALHWLSVRAYEARRDAEACEYLAKAVAAYPNVPHFRNNYGNALREIGRAPEAVVHHQIALKFLQSTAEAHNNLGLSLMDCERYDEAIPCWREALRLKPDLADAHWNLALVLLLKGEYQEGWMHYEWRLKNPAVFRCFDKPRWDGSPLDGRTILLHGEQGLGDTIHFARYAELVAERGGRVVLEAQHQLFELFRTLAGVYKLIPRNQAFPPFDVHASLLSLPAILGTRADNIPAKTSYLSAKPQLVEHWRGRLGEHKGLNVAVAWQGNLLAPTGARRSIPLDHFAPLAEIPGVRLISLQKGEGAKDIGRLKQRFPILDLADEIDEQHGAFQDTAAIMSIVDVVISADTATCHLAGALGACTWTLLPTRPDWRWLLNRADSPWYPTMRLFRQKTAGDWKTVLAEVAAELRKKA